MHKIPSKRLTFIIPQQEENDEFLESSDFDFDKELGFVQKHSKAIARKSNFNGLLMFEKSE